MPDLLPGLHKEGGVLRQLRTQPLILHLDLLRLRPRVPALRERGGMAYFVMALLGFTYPSALRWKAAVALAKSVDSAEFLYGKS